MKLKDKSNNDKCVYRVLILKQIGLSLIGILIGAVVYAGFIWLTKDKMSDLYNYLGIKGAIVIYILIIIASAPNKNIPTFDFMQANIIKGAFLSLTAIIIVPWAIAKLLFLLSLLAFTIMLVLYKDKKK